MLPEARSHKDEEEEVQRTTSSTLISSKVAGTNTLYQSSLSRDSKVAEFACVESFVFPASFVANILDSSTPPSFVVSIADNTPTTRHFYIDIVMVFYAYLRFLEFPPESSGYMRAISSIVLLPFSWSPLLDISIMWETS